MKKVNLWISNPILPSNRNTGLLISELPLPSLRLREFPKMLPSPSTGIGRPSQPMPSSHVPLLATSRTSLHFPRATSIAGSSAEFPEQVAGGAPSKPKRHRSVAGIDQDDLVDPEKLADPDSFFHDVNGVKIHHKICHHDETEQEEEGTARIGLPVILLHGFGASVFSWHRAMRPLARAVGSKVLAFDRPAFGLTSRASVDSLPLNPYSMAFSVLATLSFLKLLGPKKAILIGHSAGCVVAVNTYFEAPERVAALVLVAPAIFAPLVSKGGEKKNDENGEEKQTGDGKNPFIRIWKGLCMLYRLISGMALQMLKGMREMVGSAYNKALAAVLRSAFAVMLVRLVMDKFGILAVRNAWYDASRVTDHVVQGYTKPLRAKGWERALLEFTIAMLTDSPSKSSPQLTKRLSDITCPVLIVTGDTDRLVPSWNAVRLSKAIPGSTLEVIKNCGHLPQEERPEEFIMVVERFLQRAFRTPEEQFLQAAA